MVVLHLMMKSKRYQRDALIDELNNRANRPPTPPLEPLSATHKGAYCEHCNQRKSRNHLPQRKGWMCSECLKEKKRDTRITNET